MTCVRGGRRQVCCSEQVGAVDALLTLSACSGDRGSDTVISNIVGTKVPDAASAVSIASRSIQGGIMWTTSQAVPRRIEAGAVLCLPGWEGDV